MECIGSVVETPYGRGRVIDFRPDEGLFQIQLRWACLFCPPSAFTVVDAAPSRPSVMELNVAYESLESMRRHNVQVACREKGIRCLHVDHCVTCLLGRRPITSPSNPFFRFCDFVEDSIAPLCKSPPCLACGNPVCRKHCGPSTTANTATICASCDSLLCMDTVLTVLTQKGPDRQQCLAQLVTLYDRCRLLLVSTLPSTAQALRDAQGPYNRVGLTTGSAGLAAGVVGCLAAAAIGTPAGPPLLTASVVLGGSATLTATAADVHHHHVQGGAVAERLLALYALVTRIRDVMETVAEAVERDAQQAETPSTSTTKSIPTAAPAMLPPLDPTAVASTATRTAGHWAADWASRAGPTVAKQSRVMGVLAGGALAAVTVVLEALTVRAIFTNICGGDPCAVADRLRAMEDAVLHEFPTTAALEQQSQQCIDTLERRQRALTREEVAHLLLENAEILEQAQAWAALQQQHHHERQIPKLVTIEDDESESTVGTTVDDTIYCSPPRRPHRRRLSLLQRIAMHKEREHSLSPPNTPRHPCTV